MQPSSNSSFLLHPVAPCCTPELSLLRCTPCLSRGRCNTAAATEQITSLGTVPSSFSKEKTHDRTVRRARSRLQCPSLHCVVLHLSLERQCVQRNRRQSEMQQGATGCNRNLEFELETVQQGFVAPRGETYRILLHLNLLHLSLENQPDAAVRDAGETLWMALHVRSNCARRDAQLLSDLVVVQRALPQELSHACD